jgi:chitinase domain-containing protein 1
MCLVSLICSLISPVWLQLVPRTTDSDEPSVTGLHDVDASWVADVRAAGSETGVRVLPRIMFEQWTAKDYTTLFQG